MEEIIEYFEEEKDVLEKLIALDNKICHDNITYKDLYSFLLNGTDLKQSIQKSTLFVTEGSPFLTISILKSIFNTNYSYILFVSQRYLGINKWLVARYNELKGYKQVFLDDGGNCKTYFKEDMAIMPLGETVFIEEILNDFK